LVVCWAAWSSEAGSPRRPEALCSKRWDRSQPDCRVSLDDELDTAAEAVRVGAYGWLQRG
jgi:hypothetical protein